MPGKAMVAATEEMLTTAPPRPAGPPGRMARKACLMPSAVPTMLTSSILRMSSGSRSTISWVISTPALLTTLSRRPRSAFVPSMHRSQLWSSVTFSGRKAASPPVFLMESTVAWPSSVRMSPMTTAAPARASASAIPAPRPRAPPVTRALRPVRSYTLILASPPRDGPDPPPGLDLAPCLAVAPPPSAAVRRRSHCHGLLTVVKTSLDSCQDLSCSGSAAQDTVGFARTTRAVLRADGKLCRDGRGPGRPGCFRARRGDEPGAGLAAAGRQVRRAAGAARRRRAADAGRARLRPDQPARDRAEHRVLARRAALLLQRQGGPDHALRASVRGGLRDPLRRDRGVGFVGRGTQAGVQHGDGADAADRRADAPALVRPAEPEPVRRVVPRRRAGDRPAPRGDDLAGDQPVRLVRRVLGRAASRGGVRDPGRAVPAGPAASPGGGRGRGRVFAGERGAGAGHPRGARALTPRLSPWPRGRAWPGPGRHPGHAGRR